MQGSAGESPKERKLLRRRRNSNKVKNDAVRHC
jgi:hypothetical protein